ncbi:hypothetical protein AAFF_G00175240 [Aldrovandia affinis]|uniref:Uncharacterized protein n=1 Tax=Aldrovandia affinis TaxID=143900 RepID=A0AAD7VW70_9TELE|nr:hypothetical protein AAFF_G00175240 [Aldrovandia affinis]
MATFLRTEKPPEAAGVANRLRRAGSRDELCSCGWTGEHAALGDITKMYNSVWLKDRERHLHRFLWRDNPEEDIGSTPSRGWEEEKGRRQNLWRERPEATPKTLVLPNQLEDEDNKALGIGYLVDSDQLYMMTSVNFSKRKGRMRTGLNLKIEEVRENTPKGLSGGSF